MHVEKLTIPDILLITPARFEDSRGYFTETFNAPRMATHGLTLPFVQDNQSLSRQKGVVRGLHCQAPPHAQGKLVRCTQGAIWDVAVDIRIGSPTFGKWVAATLTGENGSQLWIPPGFLHGFCTLSDDVVVQYKCTDVWNRESERAVLWNDPALAIDWPVAPGDAIVSDKDAAAGDLLSVSGIFAFGE
ncbi:dTDP-4-dehydrorhamnose 3,5-epimerase [Gluconacetobacter entanii]|jgi:dTDP-4-dehydrorhamnose 3,5-epimerase|uniref:dTDP-4-dehydrorhamnose 3,5-epimerase n=1 Tax=Gluconacetobacter entanii TaxID=108528 RepID=UPI00187B58BF|nr:dTDP-4-dehydrorhamnose 3,5-epimerase [Gluconacetobacter entanii]MBE7620664.1 dTDP-4-dehydrorhamnose 3,5-epimerase [Komagataeibacter sp. FXV2]MBY4640618.1 dTDP-4-dehydrorhamnose 3,5-epimerase [Gluconacetobacter entanii]MCW4579103.1 dTDP-4-dehydrorhamnose 3,5-epimerase [Gluconacetobacter entanii]MCW4582504.1 dTDP-4-dehydrorhamnose 3,5-epimerase [Gluconacetobacter entanii]MCW4585930.1 dTDP-4-dehydrorhamnose 3,5-epimerase [Gluconacetobacter entanii]